MNSDKPADVKLKSSNVDETEKIQEIEIPDCHVTPLNGRLFAVEVASAPLKNKSGLYVPARMATLKNESTVSVNRYYLVAWDTDEIPEKFQKRLKVGMEINPFIPNEAQNLTYPDVIDWKTGTRFRVIHYTELAGVTREND